MPKAIIVGAGIAGIASAIRMAIKGYDVAVFEANGYPGGKLTEIFIDGFRFDAGPSLFTMPQYVDELFELAGKNAEDYFHYENLDEICKYFYEDGLKLTAQANLDEFAREIEQKTNSSAQEIKEFLAKSETIYDVTHRVFLERSIHKIKSFIHWDTLKSAFRFGRIDAFRTQANANNRSFKDQRVAQLFNRYATYNGSNPYQAPATLNVIPHFEYHFGAFIPKKGMHSITLSLTQLAKDVGVKFHFNTKITEIVYDESKVLGVKAGGPLISSDVVISNLDIWFTYHHLLPKLPPPTKLLTQERSSSALIFYWGIKGSYPELGLHNIMFADDYKAEFDAIWEAKTIYHDPTIYINISAKHVKTDAPDGHENWFVMINVPANNFQDWESLILAAKQNIITKINRILKKDISGNIVCEQILDPRSIEARTGSYQGSLYGNSSNNQFSAFLRHSNFSSRIKGLYFCGGSVHPGGGIPLALLSAKIIDQEIKNVE